VKGEKRKRRKKEREKQKDEVVYDVVLFVSPRAPWSCG
jgi:hypothetical protein